MVVREDAIPRERLCALRGALRLAAAIAVLAALTTAIGGCGSGGNAASDPNPLTLAVVPAESSAAIQQQFAPFARYVGRLVGRKVVVISTASYADTLQALRFKKADLALLGPLSYVIARNQGIAVDPVGAQIPARGAVPSYRSVGVVGRSSRVASLADAKGRRVCFADPTSTSGYLYPEQALIADGLDPQHDITTSFSGGPDQSALDAAHGACDLGFSFDALVAKILPSTGVLHPGDVRVIWRSTPIPGSPLVMRSDLDAGLKDKLRSAVLKATTDAFRTARLCPASGDCGVSGTYGYAKVADSFYDTVRKACEATQIPACKRA